MNFYVKLEEAEKLYELSNYKKAIKLYEELIEICPKEFKITDLRNNLGMAYYNLAMGVPDGDYDEAIELVKKAKTCFEHILETEPDDIDTLSFLGFLVRGVLDKPQEAINIYKKLVKKEPDNSEHWVELGSCFKAVDNYENAIECYEKAIQLDSKTEAWKRLGFLYLYNLKEYDKALECYLKAENNNPDDLTILSQISKTYEAMENFEMAIVYAEKGIESEPDSYTLNPLLGRLYLKNGQYKMSIDKYKEHLNKKPNDSFSWRNLGGTYQKIESFDKAIESYEKALSLSEIDIYSWLGLLNSLSRKADYTKGKIKCEKAIKILEPLTEENKILRKEYFNLWKFLSYFFKQLGEEEKSRDANKEAEFRRQFQSD